MKFDIGFTGNRKGMTVEQSSILFEYLQQVDKEVSGMPGVIAHHGDCVGCDSDFHDHCHALGFLIHIHPPILEYERAWRVGTSKSQPKPYLDRNQDIVDCSKILFACPGQEEEVLRSGTWATIRRARKASKDVIIVFPSGRVVIETHGLFTNLTGMI